MKTSELSGAALDWAVAKCDGYNEEHTVECHVCEGAGRVTEYGYASISERTCRTCQGTGAVKWTPTYRINYSTDWAHGGPIIQREKIAMMYHDDGKVSAIVFRKQPHSFQGETPLIAAMRCYVASKLGDEVEIPEELK